MDLQLAPKHLTVDQVSNGNHPPARRKWLPITGVPATQLHRATSSLERAGGHFRRQCCRVCWRGDSAIQALSSTALKGSMHKRLSRSQSMVRAALFDIQLVNLDSLTHQGGFRLEACRSEPLP